MDEQRSIAVVTGANAGIGRATAVRLAELGHTVYATVRDSADPSKIESMASARGVGIHVVRMDVADDRSVSEAFARVLGEAGAVDVLVNNAGINANGVVEDTDISTFQDLFNVNVCGVVRCTQAVLPAMREQRRGVIINLSSMVAHYAMPCQASYIASKWALAGLTEALAQEVAPYGIRVIAVEPGVTKSSMAAKNASVPDRTGAYDMAYRRMFQFYATGLPQGSDPFVVADVVAEALESSSPQLRYRSSLWAEELINGRAAMSDRDLLELSAIADDTTYYRRFEELFGVRIGPS